LKLSAPAPAAPLSIAGMAGIVAVGTVGAVAAVGWVGAWLATHSLQQDFAAYWVAGNARRLGLDPYLNQVRADAAATLWDGVAIFRHSRFLYPPLVAELFRPLAALPYRFAKTIFTAGMLVAWVGAGLMSGGRRARAWFFVASALFFPLYRHLERGQIDLLILLLVVLAWRCRRCSVIAGVALALAAAFKPALYGLLPVLWAGGRARAALAALGTAAALVGLTTAICGPARLREYVFSVLPRVTLYGEGGTDQMLLPPDRFPAAPGDDGSDDDGTTFLDGRRYRTTIWDVPATASVPRLLAPESPSRATGLLPFGLTILGLAWIARRFHRESMADDRRGEDVGAAAEAILLFATAVACVITSPAGWVMGLVLALPIVPNAGALWVSGRLSRRAGLALGGAWAAVAIPAPFAGFPALAGVALCALVAATTLLTRDRRGAPVVM
jgi:hypothetical protein